MLNATRTPATMRPIDLALALCVTAIWGANFSVIKLGLSAMDPHLMAAIRFALCAFPAVFFVPRPAVAWRCLVAYGLLFGVGLWGSVYAGIYFGLSAGLASLVLQSAVFMGMAIGVVVFKETLRLAQVVGTAMAACGIAVVFVYADGRSTWLGLALVLFAALAWAVANAVVKSSRTTQMFGFMVWSSLVAPVPLLVLSVCFSGPQAVTQAIGQLNAKALLSIVFQVYPTTLFGYAVWNALIKKYTVSSVAPLSLLVPVFGMLCSVWLLGEVLPLYKWAAMALVLLGLLINTYGLALWRIGPVWVRRRTD